MGGAVTLAGIDVRSGAGLVVEGAKPVVDAVVEGGIVVGATDSVDPGEIDPGESVFTGVTDALARALEPCELVVAGVVDRGSSRRARSSAVSVAGGGSARRARTGGLNVVVF